MYQGAHAITDGAKRRPNASSSSGQNRSGNAKKTRGKAKKTRGKRKKNPGAVTWILIAGATAAVAGGGIAYTMYRKRKQQQLPSSGESRPGTSATKKKNAPSFPYTEAQAKQYENTVAASAVHDAYDFSAKKFVLDETQITDRAFQRIYNVLKIPDKGSRGTGWQPYIDSWLRLRGLVRALMTEMEEMNSEA